MRRPLSLTYSIKVIQPWLHNTTAKIWHICVCSIAHTVLDEFFPYLAQMIISMRGCVAHNDIWPSGLKRGCVLGTFSTLKSAMSPNILAVGAHVPTNLRFMNGNKISDPRNVTNVPIFFNGMGHLSPFLQSLGRTLDLDLYIQDSLAVTLPILWIIFIWAWV